jgi:hypothetical protein
MMSRIGRSPCGVCASLIIRSFPHRSQVMRMNHDGNARSGSSRASLPVAADRRRSCASAASGLAGRSFGGVGGQCSAGPDHAGEERIHPRIGLWVVLWSAGGLRPRLPVTIADFRSSLAGVAAFGFPLVGSETPEIGEFPGRTIAEPVSTTGFFFRGGRL